MKKCWNPGCSRIGLDAGEPAVEVGAERTKNVMAFPALPPFGESCKALAQDKEGPTWIIGLSRHAKSMIARTKGRQNFHECFDAQVARVMPVLALGQADKQVTYNRCLFLFGHDAEIERHRIGTLKVFGDVSHFTAIAFLFRIVGFVSKAVWIFSASWAKCSASLV